MPLYRAFRADEIQTGNILIPKSQTPFLAKPKLPQVFPFHLGPCIEEHQWDGHYSTRGVSCTTNWAVALRYAEKCRIIVTISQDSCKQFGIHRYRILDEIPKELLLHRGDEEIILVSDINGALPKEVIVAVTHV